MPAPNQDEKNLAVLAHAGGIVLGFIPSLIIWLTKKDSSEYLAKQSKEALNFQITLAIAWVAASCLSFLFIGFLFYPVLWIANIVFCIKAAIEVSKDNEYSYPFALRLIQ